MSGDDARTSREVVMTYSNSLGQFDNLVHSLYAIIHRHLKDRMLFLDPQSRFFRSFVARIRAFRLPIHLEAKSAAVYPFGPRDWLRDGSPSGDPRIPSMSSSASDSLIGGASPATIYLGQD